MQFPIPHASLQANLHLLKIDLLSPLVDSLIQVSEVECSICCTRGRGISPATEKCWISLCTHQRNMPHGIAGVSVPRETGEVKGGCTTSLASVRLYRRQWEGNYGDNRVFFMETTKTTMTTFFPCGM